MNGKLIERTNSSATKLFKLSFIYTIMALHNIREERMKTNNNLDYKSSE